MGKRGPKPKYDQPMTEQLNIALTPSAKIFADAAGDLDYWRDLMQRLAFLKIRVDAGEIPPELYGALAAAETMRASGFVDDDDFPKSANDQAYSISTSAVETLAQWKSLTQKLLEEMTHDENE